MKTLYRLIYGEILLAVGFVLLAFLSLFFFFDFIDELGAIGRASAANPQDIYGLPSAMVYLALQLPGHLYELMPIGVLIGTVYALVRLAQSSEFTILRTSGLGPWRALRTLSGLGLTFTVLTFATGDYLAPAADRWAQQVKGPYSGHISVGRTGAWLRERQADRQYSINIRAMTPTGELLGVRLFAFDTAGQIAETLTAASSQIRPDEGFWLLQGVQRQTYETQRPEHAEVQVEQVPEVRWTTSITADMVAVALLKPANMRTVDLFAYIRHLQANQQSAQRYEIEFWRKVFYPLSCLVMVVLALPFAYLHFRSSGLAAYVFMGVMIGISFIMLNAIFGFIGNLRDWQPWLAAAAPSILYSLASLGAFGWLVLKR